MKKTIVTRSVRKSRDGGEKGIFNKTQLKVAINNSAKDSYFNDPGIVNKINKPTKIRHAITAGRDYQRAVYGKAGKVQRTKMDTVQRSNLKENLKGIINKAGELSKQERRQTSFQQFVMKNIKKSPDWKETGLNQTKSTTILRTVNKVMNENGMDKVWKPSAVKKQSVVAKNYIRREAKAITNSMMRNANDPFRGVASVRDFKNKLKDPSFVKAGREGKHVLTSGFSKVLPKIKEIKIKNK